MFDELFRSRAVVQRHLSSPLLQGRLEYLQHCANQGYRLATLRELAEELLLIQNPGSLTLDQLCGVRALASNSSCGLSERKPHNGNRNKMELSGASVWTGCCSGREWIWR